MSTASCPGCLSRRALAASLLLQAGAAALLVLGACRECGLGPASLTLLPGGGAAPPGRLLLAGVEGLAALLLLAPVFPAPGALLGLFVGAAAVAARLAAPVPGPRAFLPGLLLLLASGLVLLVRRRQLPGLAGRPQGRKQANAMGR